MSFPPFRPVGANFDFAFGAASAGAAAAAWPAATSSVTATSTGSSSHYSALDEDDPELALALSLSMQEMESAAGHSSSSSNSGSAMYAGAAAPHPYHGSDVSAGITASLAMSRLQESAACAASSTATSTTASVATHGYQAVAAAAASSPPCEVAVAVGASGSSSTSTSAPAPAPSLAARREQEEITMLNSLLPESRRMHARHPIGVYESVAMRLAQQSPREIQAYVSRVGTPALFMMYQEILNTPPAFRELVTRGRLVIEGIIQRRYEEVTAGCENEMQNGFLVGRRFTRWDSMPIMRFDTTGGCVREIASAAMIQRILDENLSHETCSPFYEDVQTLASQAEMWLQIPEWRAAYERCSPLGMLAVYEHTELDLDSIDTLYQIIATKVERLTRAEQNQLSGYIERQIGLCHILLHGLAARYCRVLQHLRWCRLTGACAPALASASAGVSSSSAN